MSEITNHRLLALNGEATKRVLRITPIGIPGINGLPGASGPKGSTGDSIIGVTYSQGSSDLVILFSTGATTNIGYFRGPTGNTGISISGASLVNYNLILTFSQGTTFNVGYIRGETGPTGTSNFQALTPSPNGYYPYASIFVDQYGRVTGASGTTDVASQTNIIDIFDDLTNTEINIAEFQTTISQGIVGGTW